LEQGYRIIALSYISVPAVVEVCRENNLKQNTDCAAKFRRRRIYGGNIFPMIPDRPQDAIIPRFVNLLQYLSRTDPEGNLQQYLENGMDKPRWTKIAVSGQSQGGGMAQFIAKYENTARIISFSGGWDYSDSENEKIADWNFRENITPPDKCYAAYNVNELAANSMREINEALKIPECNSFALDKPIQDATLLKNHRNPYHGDGLRNPLYKDVWIKMLGSGL
jgi:hypothetical protein